MAFAVKLIISIALLGTSCAKVVEVEVNRHGQSSLMRRDAGGKHSEKGAFQAEPPGTFEQCVKIGNRDHLNCATGKISCHCHRTINGTAEQDPESACCESTPDPDTPGSDMCKPGCTGASAAVPTSSAAGASTTANTSAMLEDEDGEGEGEGGMQEDFAKTLQNAVQVEPAGTFEQCVSVGNNPANCATGYITAHCRRKINGVLEKNVEAACCETTPTPTAGSTMCKPGCTGASPAAAAAGANTSSMLENTGPEGEEEEEGVGEGEGDGEGGEKAYEEEKAKEKRQEAKDEASQEARAEASQEARAEAKQEIKVEAKQEGKAEAAQEERAEKKTRAEARQKAGQADARTRAEARKARQHSESPESGLPEDEESEGEAMQEDFMKTFRAEPAGTFEQCRGIGNADTLKCEAGHMACFCHRKVGSTVEQDPEPACCESTATPSRSSADTSLNSTDISTMCNPGCIGATGAA